MRCGAARFVQQLALRSSRWQAASIAELFMIYHPRASVGALRRPTESGKRDKLRIWACLPFHKDVYGGLASDTEGRAAAPAPLRHVTRRRISAAHLRTV